MFHSCTVNILTYSVFCNHPGLYWLSGKPGFSQFLSPAQTHRQQSDISTYPHTLPRWILMSHATHMIFEELQPATVLTFGFPHFGERLDLQQQAQVRSHESQVARTCIYFLNIYYNYLKCFFFYLYNRSNIFLEHVQSVFVHFSLLVTFPRSLRTGIC